MTAPVFVAPPGTLAGVEVGSLVRLGGDEGRHAATVRRIRPGEPVDLVDGEGTRVSGRVTEASAAGELVVEAIGTGQEPLPAVRITVVQALIKGDRSEAAVEMLTEVGADEIVPWQADRCVVQWRGERAERGRRRWLAASTAAGKQSRRARFPQIGELAERSEVLRRIAAADLAVTLHESAVLRLSALTAPRRGEIVVIVGPEGGLTEEELAAFTAAGALSVRMGATVLRTATAATAATAVLLARSGRWD